MKKKYVKPEAHFIQYDPQTLKTVSDENDRKVKKIMDFLECELKKEEMTAGERKI